MALGAYTHMYAFVQERDFKKLGLKVLYFKHLLYGIPAQKFNRYLKVYIAPIYIYWTFIINYTGICTGNPLCPAVILCMVLILSGGAKYYLMIET